MGAHLNLSQSSFQDEEEEEEEEEENDDEDDDEEEEEGAALTYQLIADGLVDHAIEELGSDDNVTAIIVFFQTNNDNGCP